MTGQDYLEYLFLAPKVVIIACFCAIIIALTVRVCKAIWGQAFDD